MRFLLFFASLVLLTASVDAEDSDLELKLAESLVAAIVSEDLVGYSQCWISSTQMVSAIKQIDDKFPDSEIEALLKYNALRNKDIAESFVKIQTLISSEQIDRTQIRLMKCKAVNVQQRPGKNGGHTRASSFDIVVAAGNQEWEFSIDDGMLINGVWYFQDSPINLATGSKRLDFRDHRK